MLVRGESRQLTEHPGDEALSKELSSYSVSALAIRELQSSLEDTKDWCSSCPGLCCIMQDGILLHPEYDARVPAELVVELHPGVREMRKTGKTQVVRVQVPFPDLDEMLDMAFPPETCAALDLETQRCTIYDKRPWVCRVSPVGEGVCLERIKSLKCSE